MAALEVEWGPQTLAAIRGLTEALKSFKGATAAENGEELLSRKEAAKFLGISTTTLSEWIRAGALPAAIELSERNQRWKKSDLLAFAAKRRSAA